jgi:hypothetical protein
MLDYILEGGEFGECRRTQCPKVVPCTFEGCGRPAPDPWVNELLALHQECKHRNALPEAGGVNDQPEEIMRWFRVIDERVAKVKREKEERERIRRELHA